MNESEKVFKVFIGAPGDADKERDIVKKQLRYIELEHNSNDAKKSKIKIECIEGKDVALNASETPQATIVDAKERPESCDIVIIIFKHRFGSPLPDSYPHRKPNGENFESGTQEEFYNAREGYFNNRAKNVHKPLTYVYRSVENIQLSASDEDYRKKLRQLELLDDFFNMELFKNPDGSYNTWYHVYEDISHFEHMIYNQVKDTMQRMINPKRKKRRNVSPSMSSEDYQSYVITSDEASTLAKSEVKLIDSRFKSGANRIFIWGSGKVNRNSIVWHWISHHLKSTYDIVGALWIDCSSVSSDPLVYIVREIGKYVGIHTADSDGHMDIRQGDAAESGENKSSKVNAESDLGREVLNTSTKHFSQSQLRQIVQKLKNEKFIIVLSEFNYDHQYVDGTQDTIGQLLNCSPSVFFVTCESVPKRVSSSVLLPSVFALQVQAPPIELIPMTEEKFETSPKAASVWPNPFGSREWAEMKRLKNRDEKGLDSSEIIQLEVRDKAELKAAIDRYEERKEAFLKGGTIQGGLPSGQLSTVETVKSRIDRFNALKKKRLWADAAKYYLKFLADSLYDRAEYNLIIVLLADFFSDRFKSNPLLSIDETDRQNIIHRMGRAKYRACDYEGALSHHQMNLEYALDNKRIYDISFFQQLCSDIEVELGHLEIANPLIEAAMSVEMTRDNFQARYSLRVEKLFYLIITGQWDLAISLFDELYIYTDQVRPQSNQYDERDHARLVGLYMYRARLWEVAQEVNISERNSQDLIKDFNELEHKFNALKNHFLGTSQYGAYRVGGGYGTKVAEQTHQFQGFHEFLIEAKRLISQTLLEICQVRPDREILYEARQIIDDALDEARPYDMQGPMLVLRAEIYFALGESEKGLNHKEFIPEMQLIELEKNCSMIGKTDLYNSLARLAISMGNNELAKKYAELAQEIGICQGGINQYSYGVKQAQASLELLLKE
jgi:hypothetical protein